MDSSAINRVASSNQAMAQLMQNTNSAAIEQSKKLLEVSVSMSVESGKGSAIDLIA